MRENRRAGGGRKTARWEYSASETEGRKERRIMREEESGDEKGRKGGSLSLSLDVFFFPQCLLVHGCRRRDRAEYACVCVFVFRQR